MKIAIFTNFERFDSGYSLCGIVQDQVEMADKDHGRWALPYTAAVDPTQDNGVTVDDLPSDWYPDMNMGGN